MVQMGSALPGVHQRRTLVGMVMIFIVAVSVFVSALCLLLAARKRLKGIDSSPMVKASQVAALADIGSARCELTGTARAGERGLLTSPITEQPCVWHRVTVQAVHLDEDGVDLDKPSDLLSEESSQAPIILEEEDGVVVVDMTVAEATCPVVTVLPLERDSLEGIAAELGSGYDPNTRFDLVEEVIVEDTTLFVSGRPVTLGDQIGIGMPDDGPLMVSTASEATEVATANGQIKVGATLMVASATSGIAALIAL